MTLYFASAELENQSELGGKYRIHAYYDKHDGFGVEIVHISGTDSKRAVVRVEGCCGLPDRKTALIRFATVVKRITKAVYG